MKHFILNRLKIISNIKSMCRTKHDEPRNIAKLTKRRTTVEEPSLHIDTPAVGGLGGGSLPWPCEPRLHRPNASFESHALRQLAGSAILFMNYFCTIQYALLFCLHNIEYVDIRSYILIYCCNILQLFAIAAAASLFFKKES